MSPLDLPRRYEPDQLLIATDIARLLGVSRQRVGQLARHREFPTRVGQLGRSLVWRRRDIARWARDTCRRLDEA